MRRTDSPRLQKIAIAAAAMLVFSIIGYTVLFYTAGEVEFSDPGLEQAVRYALELPDARLLRKDTERLTHLDASNFGISDLTGIEAMANLRSLNLSGNQIPSLDALASLRHLEQLSLSNTNLQRLQILTAADMHQQLRVLHLDGNPELQDISALEDMRHLQEISLRATAVQDISPLAGLSGLQSLDLRETVLTDVPLEPLQRLTALERLNLRETALTNVDAIGSIRSLRYLNLHSNPDIQNLQPVGQLMRLHTLILRGVPVKDRIDIIENMPRLQRLNIRNTGVSRLEPLARLMQRGALREDVDIRDNPIAADADRGAYGYDVLLPYWNRINRRKPAELPRAPTGEIRINEVMTSNGSIAAADQLYPDWIELVNPGESAIDISGFFLTPSDDSHPSSTEHSHRAVSWQLPENTIIEPGEYILIWASGLPIDARAEPADGNTPPVQEYHADFTLSSSGATVSLFDSSGRILVDTVDVPAIPRDTSYGRTADCWQIFVQPTPGADNRQGLTYIPVHFSHNAGLYDESFTLTLAADDTIEVYYTLDGSPPDPNAEHGISTYTVRDYDSGELIQRTTRTYRYEHPIEIHSDGPDEPTITDIQTTVPEAETYYWKPPTGDLPRGTVVRALTYDGSTERSHVHSATYLVGTDFSEGYPLAIISLSADPGDLFDFDRGIYVPGRIHEQHRGYQGHWMRHPANYRERVEIPTHIAFFEPDGYPGFAVDGGIRVHGAWSRSHPVKSLRMYARKDHERENYFTHPVFPLATQRYSHAAITEYKRLMLRSGQSLFRSHLQDAIIHNHVRQHVAVDLLRYRPVVHFMNGEYWGIKNLRERFDRFFLAANYGVDPDQVIILDGPQGFASQLQAGQPGDHTSYQELVQYVESNDMSRTEHYHHVVQLMDVDSFIDYNIVRIFSGDPDAVNKHIAMWRVRGDYNPDMPPGLDGRWRWHTWDFDNALMFLENDTMTFLANDRTQQEYNRAYYQDQHDSGEVMDSELLNDHAAERPAAVQRVYHPRYTTLMAGLLQNSEFRHRFVNRFADLLNTLYSPEVHAEAIRTAAELLEPEIARHIRRWHYPFSYGFWQNQVERNIQFARERPAIQRQHIIEYFSKRSGEIAGTANIAIRLPEQGGSIQVNSLHLSTETPGMDDTTWQGIYFRGVPVHIAAIADPGYRFSGWIGHDSEQQEITVDPSDQILTARFESVATTAEKE